MTLTKPFLLFLTLSFIVVVNLQAQVGEKFYGKASYYADKFHGRSTSSGETYDRAEYTAAHRDLPFNTIVEVINTTNNRTAVVKINDRGPFAHNRMIDLSFAAAKDLELLGAGEAEVEIKILSMDKSEYIISSFYAGIKGEFNKEFNQYEPILTIGEKVLKVTLDTSYLSQTPIPPSIQSKPVTEAFVVADVLRKQQADGDKMGFRQHKYIRVIKDGDGQYRLDSSKITSPTPQEVYSVAPQITKSPIEKDKIVIAITKPKPQNQILEVIKTEVQIVTKSTTEIGKVDDKIGGFRQYQYVKLYTDSEGRIRMDTSQKISPLLVKNTDKIMEKSDDKPQTFNTSLKNSPKSSTGIIAQKHEAIKPKEINKFGFKQYSYIKVYKDIDGKTKLDTTSFERPY